jgi:hypothetical protein
MNFTPFRDRASWGALPPKQVKAMEINGPWTLHWNGQGSKWAAIEGESAQMTWAEKRMRATQLYHMRTRGWSDNAYNFQADPWGHAIWEGRGMDVRPASQGTSVGNTTSHSIQVVTGLGDPDPLPACLELIDRFVDSMGDLYGTEDAIVGHRDWKATSCPGDFLYRSLTDLNSEPSVDGTGVAVMGPTIYLDDVLAIFTQNGGYGVVDSAGKVAMFGSAIHRGDASVHALNAPIVDAETTPSGNGYFLAAADGGVFAYGDAVFQGSMGSVALNAPIVAIEVQDTGYWLAAADGGIFAFGLDYSGRPTVV